MIYGVINHLGLDFSDGLSSLRKFFDRGISAFTEKHLPGLVAGWFKNTSNEAHHPYYIDQSTNWSVFVFGEIYDFENFLGSYQESLKEDIPRLLLDLFYQHGVGFVDRLNGDFVIILTNAEEKTTYVFRDHLGINPFSYTILQDVLYYCSDTLSLCRAYFPNEPIGTEFLLKDFKFTDNTLTPNPKVKRLLPGHYLLIKEQALKEHKYWFPERIKLDNSYTKEKVFREATALIEDAIAIRVDKNLKAASHISGGLDSSTVAVLARKHYPNQKTFFGFSWTPTHNLFPSQGEKDERVLIAKTCAANQLEPVFSSFSSKDFIKHYNEPLNNSLFPHEQLTQAFSQEKGIKLIFSGYGGDEFISCGTYGVFIDLLRTFKWRKYWKVARTWSPITIVKSLVLDFLSPSTGILPISIRLQNRASTRFIRKPFKKSHKTSLKQFFLHRSRREMHLGMLYHYHIPLRTEDWYHWGSRYGIQYRYPLLDKRIVEFMLKIPSDYLYKESFGRVLLREAAGDRLPKEVKWSTLKTDPILTKYLDALSADIFRDSISDLEAFKKNSALAFFDFEKYEKALSKARRKKDTGLEWSLRPVFFRLKWIHGFTSQYAQ